jgi:predicted transcriptional regulator
MSIGEVCQSQVADIDRNATATEAAEPMREFHVGTLVVVDRTDGDAVPVGPIADRDIVVRAVAARIRGKEP